ncbi:MAG TPA: hypothetical protein VGH43_17690 [Jatrophihabitans sp.]|jgi:hypothetical protein
MYSDMGGDSLRETRTPRGLGGTGPDVGNWLAFAIAMLALSGVLSTLWGVLTLVRRGVFVATFKHNPLDLDYRAWGWTHIAVGVLAVVVAALLPRGAAVVRGLAVGVAAVSIIGNLLVISSYPVWFTIVIALDVLVIFAVTVHGTDLRPTRRQ